ncbi:hypothetical protein BIW11_00013 [Tropilaelaps mercedesae]|uniref:Uncharacterized protein n=1 Tax=Tropilaelaps mercedesae TaxID=418985 RepID=A0A1V9Y3K0_9ACAR|nr:hypothetical protein BIW11_00013 [Tropilaelaps mercedesae]
MLLLLLSVSALCLAGEMLLSQPDPGAASGLLSPERPRRAHKTKRSPYGYIIRGENHVATFQMGAPDETGLFRNPTGFNSEAFQKSAQSFLTDSGGPSFLQSVPGSVTNGLNALIGAGPVRSRKNIPNAIITQNLFPSAFNYRQAVFNHVPGGAPANSGSPVLGRKGAPVLPTKNPFPKESIPPLPAPSPSAPPAVPDKAVRPSFEFRPSIRAPPAAGRASTQYFVLGNEVTVQPDLFNAPNLPTLNPLPPFTHPFHNYPTLVTLGVNPTSAGVLPTLNPLDPPQALPTLNPPLFTEETIVREPAIIPTRTVLEPTLIAPLPPPPPPAPPLPRPLSNLPKGTFFWFKFNRKNFTLIPTFNDFMKNFQNPLLLTRPVQNSLFRPFIHGSRRVAPVGPVTGSGPVFRKRPCSVFDYFPAPTPNFPFDIPFLKPEDQHPRDGHPSGKHTTIYDGPAKSFSPTRTNIPLPTPNTPLSSPEDRPMEEIDPVDEPVTVPRKSNETPELVSTTTEMPEENHVEREDPPSTKSSDKSGQPEETTIRPAVTLSETEVITKEPQATVILFDEDDIQITTTSVEPSVRPPSFDQKDSGKTDKSETPAMPAATDTTNVSDDGSDLAAKRAGKSYRDSDYDQFFVDFTNPKSIEGVGRPDKDTASTNTTTFIFPRTSTMTTTTTMTTASSSTTPPPEATSSAGQPQADAYDDYFVDFFDPDPPGLRAKTSTTAATTTTATTTTATTTIASPETPVSGESEVETTTETEQTAAPPLATPEIEDAPESTTKEATMMLMPSTVKVTTEQKATTMDAPTMTTITDLMTTTTEPTTTTTTRTTLTTTEPTTTTEQTATTESTATTITEPVTTSTKPVTTTTTKTTITDTATTTPAAEPRMTTREATPAAATTTTKLPTITTATETTMITEAYTEPLEQRSITTTNELLGTTTNEPSTELATNSPESSEGDSTTPNELLARSNPNAENITEIAYMTTTESAPVIGETTIVRTTESSEGSENEGSSTEDENEIRAETTKAMEDDSSEVTATAEGDATTELVRDDKEVTTIQTEPETATTPEGGVNTTTTAQSGADSEPDSMTSKNDTAVKPENSPDNNTTTVNSANGEEADASGTTTDGSELSVTDENASAKRMGGHNLEGRSLVVGAKYPSDEMSAPVSNDSVTRSFDPAQTTTVPAETPTEATTEMLAPTTTTAPPTTTSASMTRWPPAEANSTTTSPPSATVTVDPTTATTTEHPTSEESTMTELTAEETLTAITAQPAADSTSPTTPALATSKPQSTTSSSPGKASEDRRGKSLPVPADSEEREGVPKTVLVDGGTRNYSDVQHDHPVVNDIDVNSSDPRKVRRAANWFVWFLDRENISKTFVSDVSRFASSRDIVYVFSSVLLVSTVFAMMGLYCTLRPSNGS